MNKGMPETRFDDLFHIKQELQGDLYASDDKRKASNLMIDGIRCLVNIRRYLIQTRQNAWQAFIQRLQGVCNAFCRSPDLNESGNGKNRYQEKYKTQDHHADLQIHIVSPLH